MPSPFPGIDPYIESIGLWQGFHHLVLTSYLEILNERLPDAYVALVEGERRLVHEPGGETGRPRPDIAITRDPAEFRKRHGLITSLVNAQRGDILRPLAERRISMARCSAEGAAP